MRPDLFKISMIAALGIFVATDGASASNKKTSPQQSSNKKNKIVTPVKKVVQPSKVVYKEPTPALKVVRTIPSTALVLNYKGLSLHLSNGLYYRREADKYISVSAPIGLKIQTLPVGYSLVHVLGKPYYYYQGTYYVQSKSEYEVVEAPADVIVATLPEEAEQITIEGKDYYIYNGNIYSIVITPDGKAFKMSGSLGGM